MKLPFHEYVSFKYAALLQLSKGHVNKKLTQFIILDASINLWFVNGKSHRDDLVFVDPQHVSHKQILPLSCAETETDDKQRLSIC